MKCFRIDAGGEYFYYAAETEDQAMSDFRDDIDDDFEDAKIQEITLEQMENIKVTMEDENENPNGEITLKKFFDDECKGHTDGSFQLCGSVY